MQRPISNWEKKQKRHTQIGAHETFLAHTQLRCVNYLSSFGLNSRGFK